tara:strand:+ start:1108 stop:1869 length:762 start_codon:yes stop_codon:yes gene_type:complete
MIKVDLTFAENNSSRYISASPFPHIVIDNFMIDKYLDQALRVFPSPSQVKWTEYDNPLEKKLMNSNIEEYEEPISKIINFMNSDEFLKFLEKLTRNEGLIADTDLIGGGLHQIQRGGKLDIHADFNVHYKTKNIRCLNAILFLNKDWREEYGGHLELWDKEMTECKQKILPIFNRLVIFNTNETSYHGHPEVLNCPDNFTRKSIALYYYLKNTEDKKGRSTKYMKRPSDPIDENLDKFRALRSIPKDKRNNNE